MKGIEKINLAEKVVGPVSKGNPIPMIRAMKGHHQPGRAIDSGYVLLDSQYRVIQMQLSDGHYTEFIRKNNLDDH